MSGDSWTPEMFAQAWSSGIAAVIDERITSLQHLAVMTAPTMERYETTQGPLRAEIDQVLEIGLAQLQKTGEAGPG